MFAVWHSRAFRQSAWACGVAVACQLACATTTWDALTPDRIRIGSIVVGETRYHDVVVTFGDLLSYQTGSPTQTYDHFDPITSRLTIASLNALGQTFSNVVVTLTGVINVASATGITDIVPNDPLFADQWHLQNKGQVGADKLPGKTGEDLNVVRAWNFATGTGVQIAVVDDGLDISHEDLNVAQGKSWDYRINAYGDPSSSEGAHGTSCAGLAAAKGGNGIGVTGVAFNARVVGYNLLVASTADFGADAMVKGLADNHIYTNSYGATDGTGLLSPSDAAWRAAIDTGTATGRGRKGAVYIWAAGNGAPLDRSDYDGQTNYQGVLAVGSLNDQGKRSSYSEPGSNLLVMAFGGEFCSGHTTTTTDVTAAAGFNDGTSQRNDYLGLPNYTRCFNGTSAAAPQAAGVVALMLEANPGLGWRDVRALLASTARKSDPGDADWRNNAAGMPINHNFGFGAIQASAAVAAATTWKNLPPQKTAEARTTLVAPQPIPDNGATVTSELVVSPSALGALRAIEFVDVNITLDHPDVGELELLLTSPSGTRSTLAVVHDCRSEFGQTVGCGAALAEGARFGVVRLMGESALGVWTLSMRDGKAGQTGALLAWGIKVYGH